MNHQNPRVAAVVLAGGKGTRLFPLTLNHSKPAVVFGGRYRLIDIPISNALNSEIRQIFVIGQYLTQELMHHLSQTYHFDQFFPGMIDFLTPKGSGKVLFEGTADAIRKNLQQMLEISADYYLILSGDQLYNIDFKKMLNFTIENDADLTIATLPVNVKEAPRMGIMHIGEKQNIVQFQEKPSLQELTHFELKSEDGSSYYLGSMGIYIFKRQALIDLLQEDKREDFSKHLIPTAIKKGKTYAFLYDGYWEDIGTIESFYKANLSLTTSSIALKTYDERSPIFTPLNHLPGTKINKTDIKDSIICDGSIIDAEKIEHSLVGLRSYIKKGTVIEDSVLLGNNYYISPFSHKDYLPERFEIGSHCHIQKAIIDEHVFIGNNVTLVNKNNLLQYDGDNIYVRDGIIIVPSGTYIPNGFTF
jgi:glucose-1-phosphate adenylyltransferase